MACAGHVWLTLGPLWVSSFVLGLLQTSADYFFHMYIFKLVVMEISEHSEVARGSICGAMDPAYLVPSAAHFSFECLFRQSQNSYHLTSLLVPFSL